MNKLYWWIHHDTIVERAWCTMAERRRYIKSHKPLREQKDRLFCLKPVKHQKQVAALLQGSWDTIPCHCPSCIGRKRWDALYRIYYREYPQQAARINQKSGKLKCADY